MASGWLNDRVCVVGTKIGVVVQRGQPEITWFMNIEDAMNLSDVLMDAIEAAHRNRLKNNSAAATTIWNMCELEAKK